MKSYIFARGKFEITTPNYHHNFILQSSPGGSDRSIDLLDVAGRELDRVRYGRRSVGRLLPASPSLPLPVCDSIGVPLAVRRGKRLPRLSSLNKPEGDQWGGRAASTRSDNPARTEPESAGAPQPTPTRPNPKEGRRREAKGKLQRQQPFSVRSAALAHCRDQRRRSRRQPPSLRSHRLFRPRSEDQPAGKRYVSRHGNPGVALFAPSALGAFVWAAKSTFYLTLPSNRRLAFGGRQKQ